MVYLIGIQCAAGSRSMKDGDENLLSTWDWTINTEYTIYSNESGGEINTHLSTLPYFTPGNILFDRENKPDMYKEDGWILAYRDFGTPDAAQPFPFFALYNKYSGIFRIMLYNAPKREGSYFIGELSLISDGKSNENGAALFTFADPNEFNCSLENYNPNVLLTAISKITAYSSWAVFDYPLLGYDPRIDKGDPIIWFNLTSIEKQGITLNSKGDIELFQQIESTDTTIPGRAKSSSELLGATSKGYATYKTFDSFINTELLSDAAKERHKGKGWFEDVSKLATSKVGRIIPYVAAMGSVLECFAGGAEKPTQWAPFNFNGQLKFDTDGAILTKRELWHHNFFLNVGNRNDMRAQRPVQELTWGIFNLVESPSMDEGYRGLSPGVPTRKLKARPEIIVNPNSGMELVKTRVAFLANNLLNAPEDTSQALATPFMTIDQAMDTGYTVSGPGEFTLTSIDESGQTRITTSPITMGICKPMGLLWELRFRIKEPTLFSDNEIVIYKKTGHRERELMLKGLNDLATGIIKFPNIFKKSS